MQINVYKQKNKVFDIFLTVLKNVFLSLVITFVLAIVLGHTPMRIVSSSMYPSMPKGSLVLVNKNYAYDKVKVGDVITRKFTSHFVTHRVVGFDEQTGYIITANDLTAKYFKENNIKITSKTSETDAPTPPENYYGTVAVHFSNVGDWLSSIQNMFTRQNLQQNFLQVLILIIIIFGFIMFV